jgi:hypothetical protein
VDLCVFFFVVRLHDGETMKKDNKNKKAREYFPPPSRPSRTRRVWWLLLCSELRSSPSYSRACVRIPFGAMIGVQVTAKDGLHPLAR